MSKYIKKCAVLLAMASMAAGIFGQAQPQKKKASAPRSTAAKKPPATAQKAPKPKAAATPKPADPAVEKARFEAALAAVTATEKAVLLIKFIADFPKSENKTRAQESLVGARAAMADEKLTAGDAEQGVKLFKLAVTEAPQPFSERLFSEIIVTIPENLFWKGQQQAAAEIARSIETRSAANAKQLLGIAQFYLRTENGDEAKRIAEAAIKLDEAGPAGHQTLGMAYRLNFDLEASERSFAKAVELEPEAAVAKRMLAEVKRALGKPDEAEALYKELLAKDENDGSARTGLVLSLFDGGKREDAEKELAKAIESSQTNVFLLAGAAYWYASRNEGDKAVEYSRQAIEKEPRFIWAHIALARGLMLQRKPVEAEQVLTGARKYGNFPTLQYEIASARLAAGFFREAAEELKKSFAVDADGVKTKLGGRIERTAAGFTELIAAERRASIFASAPAGSPEAAEQLLSLLEFAQVMSAEKPDETAAAAAAERFTSGADEMAPHRKLYAANALLQKKIAAEKALEYARAVTGSVDSALAVANPNSAVMASELYEARDAAFYKGDFLLIPEVPKQTLSAILRGRIEETAGLALLRTGNAADATVRFRRALSVLPKDSAWWRSATWNLGSSLEAEGKDEEALTSYIASYKIDKPDLARYLTVSALYKKVKGSIDGLEDEIGMSPLGPVAAAEPTPKAEPTPVAETVAEKKPEPEASPSPKTVETAAEPTASPTPEPTPNTEETPMPAVEPSPSPTPKVEETPVPAVEPTPSPTPKTEETPVPAVELTPSPTPKREETPTPAVEPTPSPTPKVEETPVPAVEPSPTPETKVIEEKSVSEPVKEETPAAKPSLKPLFETIVIPVPNSAKKPKEETAAEKTDEPNEEQPKNVDPVASGATRPRVVDGKEITGGETPPPCTIETSQESVSLINNGGSIAMLVSASEGADAKAIDARSNSLKDVEVRLEPEIAGVSGRALYVIKSISTNTGLFQVTFELPCGKKTVNVRVR